MKIAFFSAKQYDVDSFEAAGSSHQFTFHSAHLNSDTAVLAQGAEAVCVFVNDTVDRHVLERLSRAGTRLILLRCAGFNNVDVDAAKSLGMTVARVPAYSPSAVAEHTFGLILSLNRKLHKAYGRVREGDFRLEGLLGFDLNGRTIGIIGTGNIGECACRIAKGFGMRVLAHDIQPNSACEEIGISYVALEELLSQSDIVSLHCPLIPQTHHLINEESIATMKQGVMLINTSRGGIIDTQAVIQGLKSGHIGGLGIDVYEEEADLFFEDLSSTVINDDVFSRLLTFPNVLITGHQAFFTKDALGQIASTTLANASEFETTDQCANRV